MARGDDSLRSIRFESATAPRPLLQAMAALAQQSGRTLAQLEGITLGEAFDLAVATYADALPEYWRVWADWQRDRPPQPMGDL
jgi:hypothetical protein